MQIIIFIEILRSKHYFFCLTPDLRYNFWAKIHNYGQSVQQQLLGSGGHQQVRFCKPVGLVRTVFRGAKRRLKATMTFVRCDGLTDVEGKVLGIHGLRSKMPIEMIFESLEATPLIFLSLLSLNFYLLFSKKTHEMLFFCWTKLIN